MLLPRSRSVRLVDAATAGARYWHPRAPIALLSRCRLLRVLHVRMVSAQCLHPSDPNPQARTCTVLTLALRLIPWATFLQPTRPIVPCLILMAVRVEQFSKASARKPQLSSSL